MKKLKNKDETNSSEQLVMEERPESSEKMTPVGYKDMSTGAPKDVIKTLRKLQIQETKAFRRQK